MSRLEPLTALLRAFCPTPCAGCGIPRGPLCADCDRELATQPLRASPAGGGRPLHLWLGSYSGSLGRLVRAAKLGPCPPLGRRLAAELAARLAERRDLLSLVDGIVHPPVAPRDLPSHPAGLAAAAVGARLDLRVLPETLRMGARRGRARHLGARDREAHLRTSLLPGRGLPAGIRRLALVDDLLTTGATARRASALLAGAGGEVLIWITLGRVEASAAPGRPDSPPDPPALSRSADSPSRPGSPGPDEIRIPTRRVRLMGSPPRGKFRATCAP